MHKLTQDRSFTDIYDKEKQQIHLRSWDQQISGILE